eukprot:95543-Amphidinium_carterae.1
MINPTWQKLAVGYQKNPRRGQRNVEVHHKGSGRLCSSSKKLRQQQDLFGHSPTNATLAGQAMPFTRPLPLAIWLEVSRRNPQLGGFPLHISEKEACQLLAQLTTDVEEVKDWFLDLLVFQKTRFGWGYMRTFHYAQMLCPNIFGTLNHDVPRRWKHSEEKSPPTPAGRKKNKVYNYDETSCRLLPFSDKGWKDAKADAKAVADSRLQCTVGVAVPMAFGEKWYSHIIFPGTSNRSLPKTKWGDDMLCDCTQNHWQSVDSLLRLVYWFDAKINSTDAKENLLFVLDCAPVHTAQDLRARLPQHARLCYINPGTTSIAQPSWCWDWTSTVIKRKYSWVQTPLL